MKRQLTEWEKMFPNHKPNKGLIYRIFKAHPRINNDTPPITQFKMGKELDQHLPKDTQMANKHLKRCSISLIIMEMQIETTVKYRVTTVAMATIKTKQKRK